MIVPESVIAARTAIPRNWFIPDVLSQLERCPSQAIVSESDPLWPDTLPARLVQHGPPIAAPRGASIGDGRQRHADDVDKDGHLRAGGGHLAVDHLHAVAEVLALKRRVAQ